MILKQLLLINIHQILIINEIFLPVNGAISLVHFKLVSDNATNYNFNKYEKIIIIVVYSDLLDGNS